MIDPRTSVIDKRVSKIGEIIAVSSGKGGVGKSLVASTLALNYASRGFKVGFFDIDFTSPTSHLILGVKQLFPKEDKGIIPPDIYDLKYMSITYYSKDKASPLRGTDFSNVLIELLSITLWGKLDFLIIDTPPGIGDAILDLIRLLPKIKFLIVTTSSQLAIKTIDKLVSLLKEVKTPIIGIIENMKMDESQIQNYIKKLAVPYLIDIPFDKKIEPAIGNVNKLLKTTFAKKIDELTHFLYF